MMTIVVFIQYCYYYYYYYYYNYNLQSKMVFPFDKEDKLNENGIKSLPKSSVLAGEECRLDLFETLLLFVGYNGKWQWCITVITSFSGIFMAFHNLSSGESLTSFLYLMLRNLFNLTCWLQAGCHLVATLYTQICGNTKF